MNQVPHPSPHAAGSFLTTRWSMVRQSLSSDDGESQEALTHLCEAYWYPIYAYIRRCGHTSHDAEDLTQGFFSRLLEKKFLAVADQQKGKLRAFLLTCVKRHLSDERDRVTAVKRGSGKIVNFSGIRAEERFAAEPVDNLSPDRLYQRRWALTMLEFTMGALKDRYRNEGREELFLALRPFLGFGAGEPENQADLAARLGIKLNTLKSHIFRLHEHWREYLMAQVACTLDDPTSDNIKGELTELLGCV